MPSGEIRCTYRIQYDLAGGTNHKAALQAYAYSKTKKVAIKNPTRAGYKFKGWTASGAAAEYFSNNKILAGAKGDITLTATWEPVSYTVQLVKNSSLASVVPDAKEKYEKVAYDSGASFAGNTIYTSEYCDFLGWNTKSNGKGTSVIPLNGMIDISTLRTKAGTVKLYAQWKLRKHTITYVNVVPQKIEGSEISLLTNLTKVKNKNKTTFAENQEFTLKNPSKAGYRFLGWYSDAALRKKVTSVSKKTTSNLVLYGKWEKK